MIKELKGDKSRIVGQTKRLIEEQMRLIDAHYQKEKNPYLQYLHGSNKTQISDFSVTDLQKAEDVIEKKKFEI